MRGRRNGTKTKSPVPRFDTCLTPLPPPLCPPSEQKCFFDIEIGGSAAGRIVMELKDE